MSSIAFSPNPKELTTICANVPTTLSYLLTVTLLWNRILFIEWFLKTFIDFLPTFNVIFAKTLLLSDIYCTVTSASIHLYHVRLSYVIKGFTYLLTYLQSTNRCFTYASPYLWNQLPSSLRQPHSVHCPPGSPQPRGRLTIRHLRHVPQGPLLKGARSWKDVNFWSQWLLVSFPFICQIAAAFGASIIFGTRNPFQALSNCCYNICLTWRLAAWSGGAATGLFGFKGYRCPQLHGTELFPMLMSCCAFIWLSFTNCIVAIAHFCQCLMSKVRFARPWQPLECFVLGLYRE